MTDCREEYFRQVKNMPQAEAISRFNGLLSSPNIKDYFLIAGRFQFDGFKMDAVGYSPCRGQNAGPRCSDVAGGVVDCLSSVTKNFVLDSGIMTIRPPTDDLVVAGLGPLLEEDERFPFIVSIFGMGNGKYDLAITNRSLIVPGFEERVERFYETIDAKLDGIIPRG